MSLPLIALGLSAFVWEAGTRTFLVSGRPFELIVMAFLRNILLGLGTVSAWRRFQPLTILLSLFLAMFGATAARNTQAQVVAAAFAAVAVVWLATSHWDALRGMIVTDRQDSRRWRRVFSIGIAALLATTAFVSVGHQSVLRSLKGFMPSSGGNGQQSDYARDGVGDGEMLVAGTENIRSFGPIEDAPFMTDDKPSLYDVFDDRYEEPVRPVQKQDRAIALDPKTAVQKPPEHIHTESQKAQREFSTRRKPKGATSQRLKTISSDAMFYVAGRVPLHLRTEVYDDFDGDAWKASPASRKEAAEVCEIDGKPWLRLRDSARFRSDLGEAETHALKIVRMDTNVIPLPLNAHGVHIDRVDRSDFYLVESSGRVRLDREALPELVPIHIASRPVDRRRTERAIGFDFVDASEDWPVQLDLRKWRALAEEWTRNCTTKTGRLQAIESRLQSEYVLDENWRPSTTSAAPVADFLFTSKRGPDYQFATAAALLLRSIGYRTRVVSGFYADDRDYEARSGHTAVKKDDVHFWTEAALVGNSWFTVEATPGYRILGPIESWSEWLRRQVETSLSYGWQNRLMAGCLLAAMATLFACRRPLVDRVDEFLWVVVTRRRSRPALSALSLLERRAARAGHPRPESTTASRWLMELKSRAPREAGPALESLAVHVDRDAFGPPGESPNDSLGTQMIDPILARRLSLRWFQKSASADATSPGEKSTRSLPTTAALVLASAMTLLPLCSTGCRGEAAEEAHLEHAHPAHKPVSLQHAADDLKTRIVSPTLRSNDQESTEFLDIVRWLPELAGATDLKKQDWDSVLRDSQELERRFSEGKVADSDAETTAMLARLQDLGAKAKKAAPGGFDH
ncbi:Transglutaminase-like superfamily protein [Caulifigura coniformis]|uniref:Transglutaminase-like superfamily protein n=1 Tax=Caulifigura coniformis TaxID=2527983 RepID=A0A517SKC9_9PLAN|nr:transglutaminase-like domain-containing protein [Caulifigura coniformis]QDT56580.1 Transglutaminase-like superfamily protein [Caulifigura coniformis]